MLRNIKPGITFYRMDSGHILNKKIRLLYNEFDSDGYYIWSSLIDYAYHKWGYYFDLNDKEDLEWFAAEYCRKKLTLIKEVIAGCIRRGLFDKHVADTFSVLTSDMMQEVFIYATAERRKKGSVFEMHQNWLQIKFPDGIPGNIRIVPGNEAGISREDAADKTRQDLDKTKQEIIAPAEPAPTKKKREKREKKVFTEPTQAEAREYFAHLKGNTNSPGHWPADRCRFTADKFLDFYRMNGWVQGKGRKPIIDWKAAARNWIRTDLENGFSDQKIPKSDQKVSNVAQKMPKVESDINDLYAQFLKGNVTVISLESTFYNHLKLTGLINFSPETVEKIKSLAESHLKAKNLTADEASKVKYMKRFGLLEFFEQQKLANKEIIFNEQNIPG